ncbi:MAG: hypothetical protein AB7O37_22455 [Vicinamibacteria bacterium]
MRGRLVVAALLLAAFASGALAQSLAEAAAKERERRERERKKAGAAAKVVTDEQLGKSAGTLAVGGGTAGGGTTGRSAQGKPDWAPAEWADLTPEQREELQRKHDHQEGRSVLGSADPGQEEASWRERARRTYEGVRNATAQLDRLKADRERLLGDALRSTDTNEIMRLRAQAAQVGEEIARAEAALTDAREDVKILEDDARRSSVPPGWIREG